MKAIGLTLLFGSDHTITFAGDPDGLNALSISLVEDHDNILELPPNPTPPHYTGVAKLINIRSDREPGLEIIRDGTDVSIVGHPDARASLAENLSRFAATPAALGGHLHIEYIQTIHTYGPRRLPRSLRRCHTIPVTTDNARVVAVPALDVLITQWRGRRATLVVEDDQNQASYEGVLDGPYQGDVPGVGLMLGERLVAGDIAIGGTYVEVAPGKRGQRPHLLRIRIRRAER